MGLIGMYSGWSPKTTTNLVDLFVLNAGMALGLKKATLAFTLYPGGESGDVMGT